MTIQKPLLYVSVEIHRKVISYLTAKQYKQSDGMEYLFSLNCKYGKVDFPICKPPESCI